MKIDVKTVITLLGFAAVLGGFYYTTQMRLDSLEKDVAHLSRKVHRMAKSK